MKNNKTILRATIIRPKTFCGRYDHIDEAPKTMSPADHHFQRIMYTPFESRHLSASVFNTLPLIKIKYLPTVSILLVLRSVSNGAGYFFGFFFFLFHIYIFFLSGVERNGRTTLGK